MKKYPGIIRITLVTAIISFLTALIILLLFFFTGEDLLAFIGFFSMLILGAVNLVLLLAVLFAMMKNPEVRKPGRIAILIQLANIPMALFCLWAGLQLMNIARITFINETGVELNNVEVMGCEETIIDHLEIEESKTCWIHIPKDCDVKIQYTLNDSIREERVYGYLTPGMNVSETYRIGGDNEVMW